MSVCGKVNRSVSACAVIGLRLPNRRPGSETQLQRCVFSKDFRH